MRLKTYKNGECKGSWQWPEPEAVFRLVRDWTYGPDCEHYRKVYLGTVICQYCGRKTSVSKRGFMHRHERMVGEPRGRSWEST